MTIERKLGTTLDAVNKLSEGALERIDALFVQSASSSSSEEGTVTLHGLTDSTVYFADRPCGCRWRAPPACARGPSPRPAARALCGQLRSSAAPPPRGATSMAGTRLLCSEFCTSSAASRRSTQEPWAAPDATTAPFPT